MADNVVADKLIEKTEKTEDDHTFYNIGLYDTTQSGDKYISFVVENNEGNINDDKLYILGELFDRKNSVFGLKVNVTTTCEVAADVQQYKYKDGEEEKDLYENVVQFKKFKISDVDCTLTIDIDTGYVNLRFEGSITEFEQFKISLTGANGEKDHIVKDFKINLYPVNFESTTEKSGEIEYVYAGTQREIKNILHGNPEINGYTFNLVTDTNKSYFQLEANQQKQNISRLCAMTEQNDKYFLSIENAGQTIYRVVATFSVYDNNAYLVDEFTYEFAVKLNMQFVVNGETFSEEKTSTAGETNYHLTLAKDVAAEDETEPDGLFPICINLEKSTTVNDENRYIDNNDHSIHYNVLNYALYWRHDGTSAAEYLPLIKEVSIKNRDGEDVGNDVVFDSNDKGYQIIFNRDFNGTIILELTFKPKEGLGLYTYEWFIYVNGIAEISKDANSVPTERKLTSNLDPFKSADGVTPITQSTPVDSTVLKFTQDTKFGNDIGDVKYSYSYKIFNSNIPNDVTNEDLFKNERNYPVLAQKEGSADNIDETTVLPAVPLTMKSGNDAEKFYVVYKLEVSYLNPAQEPDEELGEEPNKGTNVFEYYFTYVVKNEGKIDIHNNTPEAKQSGEVDVDKGLTKDNSSGDYYLELFSYKHYLNKRINEDVYTHYELVYDVDDDNDIIKLRIGNYEASGDQANVSSPTGWTESSTYNAYRKNNEEGVYEFKLSPDSVVAYKLEINDGIKLFEGSTLIGSMKYEGLYSSENKEINSMFNSTFDNIFAYKTFINIFKDKTISRDGTGIKFKTSPTEYEPISLVRIPDTYRFGINLSKIFTGGSKFRNEYIADLIFVQDGAEIYTVPAFQNSVKTAGFKLTTENKISPKKSYKLSDIFKLDSYYAENLYINEIKQYQVIGVDGSDTLNIANWFSTDDDVVAVKETKGRVATINIPGGSVYEVYEFTAEVKGAEEDLYIIEADYKYIKADRVIVPDFTVGGGLFSYYISNTDIVEGHDTVELDLSKGFAVWKTGDDGLFTRSALSEDDEISVQVGTYSVRSTEPNTVITTNWYENLYLNGQTLKISTKALKEYKSKNIDSYLYAETLKISVGGKTFECKVEYDLDDKVSINITTADLYSEDGQVKTIQDIISGKKLKFAESDENSISSNDIVSVSEIVETGGSSYIIANSTKLDISKISNYFKGNPLGHLKIKMEVTVKTKNGNKLLTLELVISK